MFQILILSHIKLAIYFFGAFVTGCMSWLYFDALAARRSLAHWSRAIGSLLLSLSFLGSAVIVEGSIVDGTRLDTYILILKIAGYVILGWGVWADPLVQNPSSAPVIGGSVLAGGTPHWLLPLLPATVGLGYWRRATVGLERHLMGMAHGMLVLSLAEICDLRRLFVATSDIRLYEFVRNYGYLWVLHLIILAVGFILLSRWVFGYLLRRFETQISFILGLFVGAVFTVSTVVFSTMIVSHLERGYVREMQASARLIENDWMRRGETLLADSRALAEKADMSREEWAATLVPTQHIVDASGLDVVSGTVYPSVKTGLGYVVRGVGASREVILLAATPRASGGFAIATLAVDGNLLNDAAQQTGAAVRLVAEQSVIASSYVPGYPAITAPIGVAWKGDGTLDGVMYVTGSQKLVDAEHIDQAILETAIPTAHIWQEIRLSLRAVYIAGILLALCAQLPAHILARYFVKQIRV